MRVGAGALALASCLAVVAGCTGEDTTLDLLPNPPKAADAAPPPPPPMHCTTNADCVNPKMALCRPSDQICVACLADTDCMAGATCDAMGQCHPA